MRAKRQNFKRVALARLTNLVKDNWKGALVNLIHIAALYLIFPFTARSSGPSFAVLVAAVVGSLVAAKRIKKTLLRLTLSLLLAGVAVLFAAFAPFLLLPKPIYVSNQGTVGRSQAQILTSGGNPVGTLLLARDPARRTIASLLAKPTPSSIRLLQPLSSQAGTYYPLPSVQEFITDSKVPGDMTWTRNLYFPDNISGRAIQISIPGRSLLTLTSPRATILWTFLSLGTGHLIDFRYTQYPDTLPWDAVKVNEEASISDLAYIAYLDRTLESFVTGAGKNAIDMIESSVNVRPPSNLEATRLATLQFVAFSESLAGNLGGLQSLPLLHKCYDLFLKSQAEARFSKRDPLTLWLKQTMLQAYENSWPEFIENILTLRDVSDAPPQPTGCFDDLSRRLKHMSFPQLLDFVTSTNLTLPERFLVREIISSKLGDRYMKAALLDSDAPATTFFFPAPGGVLRELEPGTPTFKNIIKECAAISREALPLVRKAELPLISQGWLKPDASILNVVQFGANELATLNQPDILKSDAVRPLLNFINPLMAQAKHPSLPTSDWWTSDYFVWYAYWSLAAAVEIECSKKGEPYPPDLGGGIRQLISTYGQDAFLKDPKGRDFVPGMFCLAWYYANFDLPGADSLAKEFQDQTRMPMHLYLSSVIQNGRQ